jgi:hypothetical protein
VAGSQEERARGHQLSDLTGERVNCVFYVDFVLVVLDTLSFRCGQTLFVVLYLTCC